MVPWVCRSCFLILSQEVKSAVKTHVHLGSIASRLALCVAVMFFFMTVITASLFKRTFLTTKDTAYRDASYFSNILGEQLDNSLFLYRNAANMAGYNISIQNFLLSDNAREVISATDSARMYFVSSFYSGIDCANIFLLSEKGRTLYQNDIHYVSNYRAMLKEHGFDKDITLAAPLFIPAELPGNSGGFFYYICPIFSYKTAESVNSILCTVLFDSRTLVRSLEEYMPQLGSVGLLFGDQLVHSSVPLSGEELAFLTECGPVSNLRVRIGAKDYILSKIQSEYRGWSAFYLLPEDDVVHRAVMAFGTSFLYSVGAMLFLSVFVFFVWQPVQRQLKRLIDEINRFSPDGALDALPKGAPVFEGIRLNELQRIVAAMRELYARLSGANRQVQEAQRKTYEVILAQKNAELIGYRSQINPHFIFNSLESLRTMAYLNNDRELSRMISSLAGLFRYTLNAPLLVPLEREMQTIESYLSIMNMRFPNRFHLEKRIPEELLSRNMLAMTLQPIVENSISHGFKQRSNDCRIVVEAFDIPGEDSFAVCLTDNGAGMSADALAELYSQISNPEITDNHASIGLKNICNRLRLTFGTSAEMCFRSEEGRYMEVKLIIPYRAAIETALISKEESHVSSDAGR